jgi:O-antigen/teichoic acid export membrane protein
VPLGIYLTKADSKLIFDFSIAKNLIKFGYPFVFAGLAYWLFGSMDRWMLGEWSTMEQVGLYSIAFKIGSVILFVSAAFGQAWSPVAIKLMNDNPLTYRQLFGQLFIYWFAFLLILGTIATLFVVEFLFLAAPEEYWKASYTSIWITMGLVISGTTQLTAIGISISKKTQYFTYVAWLTAIVNFAINYLLIPKYGSLGSAIATFITYILLSSSYLSISQKLHPIPIDTLKLSILLFFLFSTIAISSWFNSLFWSWNLSVYKIIWIIFMIIVFITGKIIDINHIKMIFIKRNYEK